MKQPNKIPFTGVLFFVDRASDKSPSGACGHRVVITAKAAEAALPSLLGMAVNYKVGWGGHDPQRKIGIIEEAVFCNDAILVGGYISSRDFSGQVDQLYAESDDFGMSYEIADARVDDMRQEIWIISRITFTGAAILRADKAAYRETSFRLKAVR